MELIIILLIAVEVVIVRFAGPSMRLSMNDTDLAQ